MIYFITPSCPIQSPRTGCSYFSFGGDGGAHRAEVVSHNTDGQLTFLIPASLTSGDYGLEVRANRGQGPLRSGSLEGILTVS